MLHTFIAMASVLSPEALYFREELELELAAPSSSSSTVMTSKSAPLDFWEEEEEERWVGVV